MEVRWTSLCEDSRYRGLDEAEIVLSLDGGRTFPVRVTPDFRPCATAFLWTVPALPAPHARLALRAGADEDASTESLEIVSADFRILPDPDGRVEQLRRRAAEWWTPSTPPVPSAEDLLDHSLSPARPQVGTPFAMPVASVPPHGPSAVRLELAAVAAAPAVRTAPVSTRRAASRAAGAITPLRL